MPTLHYGSGLEIELDVSNIRQTIEAIGAHVTRGGWVSVVDAGGRQWSLLVSVGIPVWVSDDEPDPAPS